MDELRVVLNFMLNYAGISFNLTSDDTLEVHLDTSCAIKIIYFPRPIAQCLGLLRRDGLVPLFLRLVYEGKFTLDLLDDKTAAIDNDEGFWLSIDRPYPLDKELTISLPFHKDTFIWNGISTNSFQMMVVGLDKMKRTFTGTDLTKTLAVVPIHPNQASVDYQPFIPIWKTLQMGLHTFLNLTFQDTRGNPFKNTTLNLVLQFRKNTI